MIYPFNMLQDIIELLAKSNGESIEDVSLKVLAGVELGFTPMFSYANVYLIPSPTQANKLKKSICYSAFLKRALLKRNGYFYELENNEQYTRILLFKDGMLVGNTIVYASELQGNSNAWSKNRSEMIFKKCLDRVISQYAPEIFFVSPQQTTAMNTLPDLNSLILSKTPIERQESAKAWLETKPARDIKLKVLSNLLNENIKMQDGNITKQLQ